MERYLQTFLQPFQDLKIQLGEITSATNDFHERNCIGGGGFGKVYKGQVSHSKGRSMAAIKRLDPKHGQGIAEFLKEIMTLSDYSHENLVSLLGFCCEGSEMILVYEHASHESLDKHLNSIHLTWSQRFKICLDAAKGLSFLHDPRETHRRLIHCDVKSSNILLDDQWNAKVSDLGLSTMGSANEQHSVIVTPAAGTKGYIDPLYWMTHTLTKESDVYSFGVVLFEVLCGRLCYTHSDCHVQQTLVPTWIESYEQKKLNGIIFKNQTIQPLDQNALKIFSNIAYRCLKESREDRPMMADVVEELETAFESQEFGGQNPHFDYEEMTMSAEPPLNYRSKLGLKNLLSKGVFLNGGKTWFSLNERGQHYEMVCFICADSYRSKFKSNYNSRFVTGTYVMTGYNKSIAHVKAQFLSPRITYSVNLVFKFKFPYKGIHQYQFISLKYKLQGETKTLISYLAYDRDDEWWMCELYQFTSDERTIHLEILFEGFGDPHTIIEVEGMEFWPLGKVEHEVSEDENLDMQPISDSDANWEEIFSTDYEDIMKRSVDCLQWTTKKEAYTIIRKGFLIDDGKKWFYLDKNRKKCHMLSAADVCSQYESRLPLPKSRFGVATVLGSFQKFSVDSKIQSELVSSDTKYACYLVYKLPKDQSRFEEAPVKLELKEGRYTHYYSYIYLASPQTPVIKLKAEQNTHNPVNKSNIKDVRLPQLRGDGWMEVQIWKFQTLEAPFVPEMFTLRSDSFELTTCDGNTFAGLIVEGFQIRPFFN